MLNVNIAQEILMSTFIDFVKVDIVIIFIAIVDQGDILMTPKPVHI